MVTATGVGSMPGTDFDESCRLVLGELPDLPHLPELPARGIHAAMTGRALALLPGLPADVQPTGWRLVPRPGGDLERAVTLLAGDLEALQVQALGYEGPLKVQVAGPWTLAATVELPRGTAALADAGASRDLAAALAEGVAAHVDDVRRRVPGAQVVVQLDEPSLPAVLAGRVPTPSGLGTIAPVEEPLAVERLAAVVDSVRAAGGTPWVHCCAGDAPVGLLLKAGAAGISLDTTASFPRDQLAAAVDAGARPVLGVLPSLGPGAAPTVRDVADPVRRLWRDLGFPPERLAEHAVITTSCGLAGASSGWARTALGLLHRAARALTDEPEGRT